MSWEHSATEIRCQVAVIVPATDSVLTCGSPSGCTLPSVLIGRHDRPCEQIQKLFRERWGLNIFLVEMLCHDGVENRCLWVAELLDTALPAGFVITAISDLPHDDDADEVVRELGIWSREALRSKPTARVGWIEDARRWIERVTGDHLFSTSTVDQYNGGGGFCLLRWQAHSGRRYWLKAVAKPNQHEFALTSFICSLAPDVSPLLMATHHEWNAWLMLEDHTTRSDSRPSPDAAVRALVQLQGHSLAHIDGLLERGAVEQRSEHVEQDLLCLFDYLDESMGMQTSTRAPRLAKSDLSSVYDVLVRTYRESEGRVPVSLLHGDLTGGNVSGDGDRCRILDWCESYIGFAPISLHHLVMLYSKEDLPAATTHQMVELYAQLWESEFNVRIPRFALACAPLLAAASALYGRGSWLHSPKERERRRSYSRTLARHMAREAQALQERGELCLC